MASSKPNAAPKAAPKGGSDKKDKGTKTEGVQVKVKGYIPTLQKLYKDQICEKLTKEFGLHFNNAGSKTYKDHHKPGSRSATGDKKLVEIAQQELTTITGQKAILTILKKEFNFNSARECPSEQRYLRSTKMYEFLDRLIAVCCPYQGF